MSGLPPETANGCLPRRPGRNFPKNVARWRFRVESLTPLAMEDVALTFVMERHARSGEAKHRRRRVIGVGPPWAGEVCKTPLHCLAGFFTADNKAGPRSPGPDRASCCQPAFFIRFMRVPLYVTARHRPLLLPLVQRHLGRAVGSGHGTISLQRAGEWRCGPSTQRRIVRMDGPASQAVNSLPNFTGPLLSAC